MNDRVGQVGGANPDWVDAGRANVPPSRSDRELNHMATRLLGRRGSGGPTGMAESVAIVGPGELAHRPAQREGDIALGSEFVLEEPGPVELKRRDRSGRPEKTLRRGRRQGGLFRPGTVVPSGTAMLGA